MDFKTVLICSIRHCMWSISWTFPRVSRYSVDTISSNAEWVGQVLRETFRLIPPPSIWFLPGQLFFCRSSSEFCHRMGMAVRRTVSMSMAEAWWKIHAPCRKYCWNTSFDGEAIVSAASGISCRFNNTGAVPHMKWSRVAGLGLRCVATCRPPE
jgi:hypothetical protein